MEKIEHKGHSVNNIRISFFLNLIFALIEIGGGFFTNSLLILSNGIHDLGDSISLGFSWYLEKISLKPSNEEYTYGYRRYSLLASLISASIIIATSFIIIFEAISRLIVPEYLDTKGVFIFGCLGIIFNGSAILKLLKGNTFNERFAMLHLLDDLFGWGAVIVVSVIMLLNKKLSFLDPLFSIFISIYLLYIVIKNMKDVLNIFLQSVPKDMNVPKIRKLLSNIKEIKEIHDIHIWSIDGNYNVLSIHVTVKEGTSVNDYNNIKQNVRAALVNENIHHATIEICGENEPCLYKEEIL
jgi:cobalt-zinc-cadmium efflux system protein